MIQLRDFISAPIPEIFEAARLLDLAVNAHFEGDRVRAANLIREADMDAIGKWLDPIWLRRSEATKAIRVANLPPEIPRERRYKPRNAPTQMKRELIARDGHHCRYCGIPLVRVEVRQELNTLYPSEARWISRKEYDQHRGLQVMWLQYDHIQVHSRGGKTTLDNLVVSCVACNYGRDKYTLEEMRISHPVTNIRLPTWDGRHTWTGLERILSESRRCVQALESRFGPR